MLKETVAGLPEAPKLMPPGFGNVSWSTTATFVRDIFNVPFSSSIVTASSGT